MAWTKKNYGGTDYISDKEFDYTTAIREAAAHGDYEYAGSLEKSRNAKIDGEGLSYAKTYNYQNGTSPNFESRYGSKINKTLSEIMNRKPFSYDYTKDDSYKALEKVYTQNGKYAMQDTLGDAAALTGGRASTAAVSASQQAYNRYMSELSANIPALEQAAYGRYRDEEASLYNQLGVYQQMDDIDYGRYRDSWNRDYMLGRDAVEDARYDEEIRYRDERNTVEDARYDDEIAYERDMDSITRLMNIAQVTGDYSVLLKDPALADKYGFTEEVVTALNDAYARGVSDKEIAEAFTKAQYMAQYGDFSLFRDAGFTDEQIAVMKKAWDEGKLREDALFAAQFGDYSLLSSLGIGIPVGMLSGRTSPVTAVVNPQNTNPVVAPASTEPVVEPEIVDSVVDSEAADSVIDSEATDLDIDDDTEGVAVYDGASADGFNGNSVGNSVESILNGGNRLDVPDAVSAGNQVMFSPEELYPWDWTYTADDTEDETEVDYTVSRGGNKAGGNLVERVEPFNYDPIGDHEHFKEQVEQNLGKGNVSPGWLVNSESGKEQYLKLVGKAEVTEDDVIAAVATLAAAGEYVDAARLGEAFYLRDITNAGGLAIIDAILNPTYQQ